MAPGSYFIFVAVVQTFLFQAAYTQCLNRVVPNCAPNVLPIESYLPLEGLLPNQVIVSQPGPLALPAGPLAYPPLPNCAPYPFVPSLAAAEPVTYAPTVIQDSSVANNLASTLQLLVVSNLLSSTLPGSCDPGYFAEPYQPVSSIVPVGAKGPYGYIY